MWLEFDLQRFVHTVIPPPTHADHLGNAPTTFAMAAVAESRQQQEAPTEQETWHAKVTLDVWQKACVNAVVVWRWIQFMKTETWRGIVDFRRRCCRQDNNFANTVRLMCSQLLGKAAKQRLTAPANATAMDRSPAIKLPRYKKKFFASPPGTTFRTKGKHVQVRAPWDSQHKARSRGRCIMCQAKTSDKCFQCEVYLCRRCWSDWHSGVVVEAEPRIPRPRKAKAPTRTEEEGNYGGRQQQGHGRTATKRQRRMRDNENEDDEDEDDDEEEDDDDEEDEDEAAAAEFICGRGEGRAGTREHARTTSTWRSTTSGSTNSSSTNSNSGGGGGRGRRTGSNSSSSAPTRGSSSTTTTSNNNQCCMCLGGNALNHSCAVCGRPGHNYCLVSASIHQDQSDLFCADCLGKAITDNRILLENAQKDLSTNVGQFAFPESAKVEQSVMMQRYAHWQTATASSSAL